MKDRISSCKGSTNFFSAVHALNLIARLLDKTLVPSPKIHLSRERNTPGKCVDYRLDCV